MASVAWKGAACVSVAISNKCSAVAEMGNRLATTHMGLKEGEAAVALPGELGPHLTQCGLDRGLPQVAS